jgi:hypothetical protein
MTYGRPAVDGGNDHHAEQPTSTGASVHLSDVDREIVELVHLVPRGTTGTRGLVAATVSEAV